MAANLIGVNKRLMTFDSEGTFMRVMFNPEIVKKSEPYEAVEGCLSLSGARRTRRWRSIQGAYQRGLSDPLQDLHRLDGPDYRREEEIDHCDGILI